MAIIRLKYSFDLFYFNCVLLQKTYEYTLDDMGAYISNIFHPGLTSTSVENKLCTP